MNPLIKYKKAIEVVKSKPKGMVLSYENVLADVADYAVQLEERVRELEEELGEIQQIASSRGLDSQNTYDSVLEDIEDRCLKALKGKS